MVLKLLFTFIIIIGIVGNMICIIIYGKKKIKKSLTIRFLLYLSITDLVILVLCAIESSVQYLFSFDLRALSLFTCRFDTFLTYFLTQTRNFLSMAITIESKIFRFLLNKLKILHKNNRKFL